MRLAVPSSVGVRLIGEVVRRLSDAELERRFGSAFGQRLAFSAMVRGYVPTAAAGFRGVLIFELTKPVTGRPTSRWAVSVDADGARAGLLASDSRDAARAALTVTVAVADFARVACGLLDPVEPVLKGRATASGDLALASRLAEMFGAPRPR